MNVWFMTILLFHWTLISKLHLKNCILCDNCSRWKYVLTAACSFIPIDDVTTENSYELSDKVFFFYIKNNTSAKVNALNAVDILVLSWQQLRTVGGIWYAWASKHWGSIRGIAYTERRTTWGQRPKNNLFIDIVLDLVFVFTSVIVSLQEMTMTRRLFRPCQ